MGELLHAEVKTTGLICHDSGQDGYDSCLLGLGVGSDGGISL
jgi:hypothetical protein